MTWIVDPASSLCLRGARALHFLSYSARDAGEFAQRLHRALRGGEAPVEVWIDREGIHAGELWTRKLEDAIAQCETLLFVMTRDSVRQGSVCENECMLALQRKKPIIPLRLAPVDLPFLLNLRQWLEFTDGFEVGLARLRNHLRWLDTTEGQLAEWRYRLSEAERDLESTTHDTNREATELEVARLRRRCDELQRAFVEQRAGSDMLVDEGIRRVVTLERRGGGGDGTVRQVRIVNKPPDVAPDYFQDRQVETRRLAAHLRDDTVRLVVVRGRSSMGKTAMVCRLLEAVQKRNRSGDEAIELDAIVYLRADGGDLLTARALLADLAKLLHEDDAGRLEELFANPAVSLVHKVRSLLAALDDRRIVVLIDALQAQMDQQTGRIRDDELESGLEQLLGLPSHRITVLVTTRTRPTTLTAAKPASCVEVDLDHGLPSPDAEMLLRELGKKGAPELREAPDALLDEARRRTNGNPLALKALYTILSADRRTSLRELLRKTENLPPDEAVDAFLMRQAFGRLERTEQRVAQALSVYQRPVRPEAVDYALRPYLDGRESKPILEDLVKMELVHRDDERYLLPAKYWDLVLEPLGDDEPACQEYGDRPSFTQLALLRRGADWFRVTRRAREAYRQVDDVAPQLSEIDLRIRGKQHDIAAEVLLSIDDDYLIPWGFTGLVLEQHLRLRGKLTDRRIEQASLGMIGTAYYERSDPEQAKTYYSQALRHSRAEDEVYTIPWLVNLGNANYELGRTTRAIDLYEEAQRAAQRAGRRDLEAAALSGLSLCHADMGQFEPAVDRYEQALAIALAELDARQQAGLMVDAGFLYAQLGHAHQATRSFLSALDIARGRRDHLLEARCLAGRAEVLIDLGELQQAVDVAREALAVNERIDNRDVTRDANCLLALAHLRDSDVSKAWAAVEEACKRSSRRWSHPAFVLHGIVALRRDDPDTALTSFQVAISETEPMLEDGEVSYLALDARGLALAGDALCGHPGRLAEAADAFRAARTLTTHEGVLARVHRLMDDLAESDRAGILAEVRLIAEGTRLGPPAADTVA